MNLEFHYYIIYFLCREAGFAENESQTIAYSSQYVDNNLVAKRIKADGIVYETIATQNYGWWDDYFPKNVYAPFHFFPGDTHFPGARRKDGKQNPLNCTPGSENVKRLLLEGLKTRNLYRVGIALHTYADSWAHQNFSGFDEEWNTVDTGSIVPHIGHAQSLNKPDGLKEIWQDPRLDGENSRVENAERFFRAARMIFKFLRTYNKQGFDDHDIIMEKLKWMTGIDNRMPTSTQDRIFSYIIDEDVLKYDKYEWYGDAVYDEEISVDDADGLVGYDKILWLKDAFFRATRLADVPLLRAKDDFFSSRYYQWCEAAKAHLNSAKAILAGILPS